MEITEVYQRLAIPPNLVNHMSMVEKIVKWLENRWSGEKVDWALVKEAALLHDLGNIVKFDFIKNHHFLGEEINRIEFWKEKQKEIIKKYGEDDHLATEKMLEEIGVSKEVREIVRNKGFSNSVNISQGVTWELKILFYADLRISPKGLVTMKERLDEVTNRLEKYKNDSRLPDLIKACEEIEKQIQAQITDDLAQIALEK